MMNYNGQYNTHKFYATHDALSTTLSTIMMDVINGIVPLRYLIMCNQQLNNRTLAGMSFFSSVFYFTNIDILRRSFVISIVEWVIVSDYGL